MTFPEWGEIDWKETGAVLGVLLVLLGGAKVIGRWIKVRILLPPITEGLRVILEPELTKLHTMTESTDSLATSVQAVATSVSGCMRRIKELDDEMDVIWELVRVNRARINESNYLLDSLLGIERRTSSETEHVPERRRKRILTPIPEPEVRDD